MEVCERLLARALDAFALGEVDRDPRHADHLPVELPRRDPHQHVDDRAVLASAPGLVLVGGLTGQHPRDLIVGLVGERGQLKQALADRLLGTEAVHPLGAVVPVAYASLEIDRDDRVGGVLGGVGEARELALGAFALAHVLRQA